MTGWLWSLITVLGPILLIAAILYAYFRNRRGRRAEVARAERGARELREKIRRDPQYHTDD